MDWSKFNPIPAFREGTISLFSDGKFSMKRLISFLFALAVLRMTWHILNRIVPPGNQMLFEHCFDMLCYIMTALLLGATWKDIVAMKNGTGAEETKQINAPDSSVTTNTPTETSPDAH